METENTKTLDYGELIADLDAQINQLAGKREMLIRLRSLGARIVVPAEVAAPPPAGAPAEAPAEAASAAGA